MRARALPVFDQQSWDGVTWSDITVGDQAPSTYNDGAFPIVVTNAGAMTERFALRVLTGGTDVEVIGQNVGNLGTFSRNTAIAPINPIAGVPYFTLPAAGWGAGLLIHWLRKQSVTQRWSGIAYSLIIGGALGNGVDRAVYGAVVDFVHFHWGSFSWYIFNIADVAIVVGVLGLLYKSFRPSAENTA